MYIYNSYEVRNVAHANSNLIYFISFPIQVLHFTNIRKINIYTKPLSCHNQFRKPSMNQFCQRSHSKRRSNDQRSDRSLRHPFFFHERCDQKRRHQRYYSFAKLKKKPPKRLKRSWSIDLCRSNQKCINAITAET